MLGNDIQSTLLL